MTSAIDELCRLLDERGVEWTYEDGTVSFNDGERWLHAWAYNDGTVCVSMGYLTPEQAIAATLGSCNCSSNCTNSERTETCHDTGESRIFHCSECGLGLDDVFIDDEEYYPFADFPRFCPFCGAKVVEPATNDIDAEVTE